MKSSDLIGAAGATSIRQRMMAIEAVRGVIDGFRWAILGGVTPLYWPSVILSVVITIAMLFTGITYFRKTEKTFADII